MCEGHHHGEECGCGQAHDEDACGCGEHHGAGHGYECSGGGHRRRHHCRCGCCGGSSFQRRFPTKEERIAELEEYLKALEAEAQGVREALAGLRSQG